MNRLERVGETLRAALNALAVAAPEWLRAVAEPDWSAHYGSRVENFSLLKTEAGCKQLAAVIGKDGSCCMPSVQRTHVSGWQRCRRFNCWSGPGRSSSLTTAAGSPVCAIWTA